MLIAKGIVMIVVIKSEIACAYITPFSPINLGNNKMIGINTIPCRNEFRNIPPNAFPIDKYKVE